MTIQMKALEQCFPVVLFNMLYNMVLTFESLDGIQKCSGTIHTTEQCFPVELFIVQYKVVLTFELIDEIL